MDFEQARAHLRVQWKIWEAERLAKEERDKKVRAAYEATLADERAASDERSYNRLMLWERDARACIARVEAYVADHPTHWFENTGEHANHEATMIIPNAVLMGELHGQAWDWVRPTVIYLLKYVNEISLTCGNNEDGDWYSVTMKS
jgi:hypothetical protein